MWPWNLGWRSLKIIQIGTIRKLVSSFLFVFHSNCGSISHPFWVIARYWSKIVNFSYPPCIRRPRYGGWVPVGISPSQKKTRMAWLPDGEKNSKISLFVLTQLTNVTDRHTQTDTAWRHRPRLCIASRGKISKCEYVPAYLHLRKCENTVPNRSTLKVLGEAQHFWRTFRSWWPLHF